MSKVYVSGLDVPDYRVLQHNTPVLETRDPTWSEESNQWRVYVVGDKLIVVNTKK